MMLWLLFSLCAAVDPPADAQTCTAPFPFEKKDTVLQHNLIERLEKLGYGPYLADKRLAVSVADLTRRGKRFYAGVNDHNMVYAASLPKIAILLAVIEAVNQEKIEWTYEFDRRLQSMIIDSNNQDASWAIDLVGLLAIEDVLRDPRYCLYDDTDGGLWVGHAYRPDGATNRDPLRDITHGATTHQVARFYAMLDAGYLVSRHWSFRMFGLMSPPMQFHKFVGALSDRQGLVFLARKSGTWRDFHADSALIQHQGVRYIVTALAELRNGETVLRDIAKVADDLMMEGAHRKTKVTPSVRRDESQ